MKYKTENDKSSRRKGKINAEGTRNERENLMREEINYKRSGN